MREVAPAGVLRPAAVRAFNEMAAYSQVIAQLKWTLLGMLLAFVAAIVVLERILVWGVRAIVKRARA